MDDKLNFYAEANKRVAILCNHQKGVTKKAEESLEKLKQKIEEMKDEYKKIKKNESEKKAKIYKERLRK